MDAKEMSPREVIRLFIEVLRADDEKVQHHIDTLEKLTQRVDVEQGPHLVRLKLKALVKARDAFLLRQNSVPEDVPAGDLPNKVGQVLEEVLEHLKKADSQSSAYSGTLGTAIEQIKAAKDMVVLQNLSQHLIERGTRMKEATEQFQSEMGQVAEAMTRYQERISALEREVAERTEEAMTDTLTGAYNRRAFDNRVPGMVVQARRERKPLSLCYMDLDHFKEINDTYGHQAGDDVLVNFSQLVNHKVGSRQVLYRLGGDEFCLVFFGFEPAKARATAHSLCKAVAEKPYVFKELKFNISLSGGFAELKQGETLEQLLKRADGALYRAKDLGRARVCEAD
ncbi:GGDEF domain-containing protein [Acanthopleuribacter pedis]|uniref:diguanylate cyclase n=1 Tax=Acanthopleuribacter pedis TaxID=442870 RepID=A0A8J7U2A2_9BACT|nr:GGDEF domain-containing protein [Acanthopleuribacter pedis]MBO1318392.1 GGDEF domain-containing protein [Acanthopleuribacter pedis]